MAYDEALAARVRGIVGDRPGITERKMFGGICFMTGGNMFIGISKDDLMARLDKADHDAALAKPGARPMDFTGRPMTGYIFVKNDSLEDDATLSAWVEQCYSFARTLPAKEAGAKKKPMGSRKKKTE